MDLDPVSYYFMITKKQNMSAMKYKLAYLNQYPPILKTKALWDNDIHNIRHKFMVHTSIMEILDFLELDPFS